MSHWLAATAFEQRVPQVVNWAEHHCAAECATSAHRVCSERGDSRCLGVKHGHTVLAGHDLRQIGGEVEGGDGVLRKHSERHGRDEKGVPQHLGEM